jgi:hypothetical protein
MHQFRRLIAHLQDLMKLGELESVSSLANHYISLLDPTRAPEPEDLGRFPELVHTLAGLRSDFWLNATRRLNELLLRYSDQPFIHHQILNALVNVAHTVARYEEFEVVEAVGTAIQKIAVASPEKHDKCCTPALSGLLSVHVIERVLELFLQKRDDAAWVRTASALLKLSGSMGIGKAFYVLEEEQNTANRLALIRLIGRLGPAALEEGRKSLKDERWFVVRNACKLLGELKDPDLATQLGPLLGHSDSRVQKAALDAIRSSRDPKRGAVLADSLPFLHPQLRDEVLNELQFLRDPACVPSLDRLIFIDHKGGLQARCTQVLAGISTPEAQRALLHVLSSPNLELPARRIALRALSQDKSGQIKDAIRQYAESANHDPLAAEMLALLR